jgi:hypothetical protein
MRTELIQVAAIVSSLRIPQACGQIQMNVDDNV